MRLRGVALRFGGRSRVLRVTGLLIAYIPSKWLAFYGNVEHTYTIHRYLYLVGSLNSDRTGNSEVFSAYGLRCEA